MRYHRHRASVSYQSLMYCPGTSEMSAGQEKSLFWMQAMDSLPLCRPSKPPSVDDGADASRKTMLDCQAMKFYREGSAPQRASREF